MSKHSAIFVSDRKHLSSPIPGGVQVCTAEYVELLAHCGLHVEPFPVDHSRSIWTRARIKAGIETYHRYDFDSLLHPLCRLIESSSARIVALNQVALLGFARRLKKRYGGELTVLVLSHGNESGDLLHQVVHDRPSRGFLGAIQDEWLLGSTLRQEAEAFGVDADIVLTISETDQQISNWLGARSCVYIPRVFRPVSIEWKPVTQRVGFIGTLDHPPNFQGISAVLAKLESLGSHDVRVRIVGGPRARGESLRSRFKAVDYLGPLDEESLEREVSTWAAFANPVFWYSRGASTKLAFAVNRGLPVASTPAGNRGYAWTEGRLSTSLTPLEMARELVRISSNPVAMKTASDDVKAIGRSGPTMDELAGRVREAFASVQAGRGELIG